MKRIDEVGKDFDSYAEKWAAEKYKGNVFKTGPKVEHELSFPGDEWGERVKLIENGLILKKKRKIMPQPPPVQWIEKECL